MAFIGNTPTTQAFTPAVDYFSGNGSTTAFTLSRPVASVAQVQVTIDNVAQNPSSAYTVSSNTITFTSAPLSGTNNIYVYYTSPITQVIAPGQGTVGTTALVDASVTTAKLANLTTLPTSGGNITLPAVTGTMMVSGNMPAFSVWNGTAQTFTASVYTKVTFDVKEYDTNTNFSLANSRFTPTVAGYYAVSALVGLTATTEALPTIYKNGSEYKRFVYNTSPTGIYNWGGTVASIYMNGSTDYLEFYMYQNSAGASRTSSATQAVTYFNGCLIRAA
jgi:hypothetical protein